MSRWEPHKKKQTHWSTFAILAACIALSLLSVFSVHFRSIVAVGLDSHLFHGHGPQKRSTEVSKLVDQANGSKGCNAGCTWDPAAQKCSCKEPSTAAPAKAAAICPPHASRTSKPCGDTGISRAECEALQCCWQLTSGAASGCFKKKTVGWETYKLLSNKATDSGRDLKLGLVQTELPEYGRDFEELDVQVRHETPERLHVKISPAGVRRWEVPETLLPRPRAVPFPASKARYKLLLPQEGDAFSFTVARCSQAAAGTAATTGHASSGCDGDDTDGGSGKTEQASSLGGGPVFNTSGFGLVFKDQYLQLTTRLQLATTLYGLGQRVSKDDMLRLPRSADKIVLWNYDIPASRMNVNQYGSHPFYLQVDADGTSSGVLLLNSNGMEVMLHNTRLAYRVLGGVFDLYFFMGPSPEAVIQQYQQVVGRPAMPPYWSLGFHHCRWGYRTLGAVKDVVSRYAAAAIPLEVMWTDIDYMDRFRDFTFDPTRFPVQHMREFVARLHAAGQKWVPIIDCGIPVASDDAAYQQGLAADVFIKDVTGKPYLGQVWPGATHYPDFLSVNRTWPWWHKQLQRMYSQVPFDGLWIDMNEASNFCSGEVCVLHKDNKLHQLLGGNTATPAASADDDDDATLGTTAAAAAPGSSKAAHPHEASHGYLDHELDQLKQLTMCHLDCKQPETTDTLAFPPYAIAHGMRGAIKQPKELGKKAIAMSATGLDGTRQYDAHNLYGLAEAAATRAAMVDILGRRPFLLTRSTFSGSGRLAAHWGGDNNSSWADLRHSVASLLNSNMQGMAMAGSDICGFLGSTTEELCARWMSAGSFYTFSRNHNSLYSPSQEPYLWPTVAAAARKALGMRYRLLPYLYSCFYKVHVEGGTVAKPIFFPFPAEFKARNVADQWLLGDSILVSPVLDEGKASRKAYFPTATWYNLWTLANPVHGPTTVEDLSAPLGDIPLHLRGGSILAMQQEANTTAGVRASPVSLVLALDKTPSGTLSSVQERCSSVLPAEALTAAAAGTKSSRDLLSKPADGEGSSGGSSSDSSSSSSMQLVGCGLMYLDSGESLTVPAPGSLLLHFTAMATLDFSKGWVKAAPAAGVAGAAAGGGSNGRRHLEDLHEKLDVPKLQEIVILGFTGPAAAATVKTQQPDTGSISDSVAELQNAKHSRSSGGGGAASSSKGNAAAVKAQANTTDDEYNDDFDGGRVYYQRLRRRLLAGGGAAAGGAAASEQQRGSTLRPGKDSAAAAAAAELPPGAAFIVVPDFVKKAREDREAAKKAKLAAIYGNSSSNSSSSSSSNSSSNAHGTAAAAGPASKSSSSSSVVGAAGGKAAISNSKVTGNKAGSSSSSSTSSAAAGSRSIQAGGKSSSSSSRGSSSSSSSNSNKQVNSSTAAASSGDAGNYHYHFDTYYEESEHAKQQQKQQKGKADIAASESEGKSGAAAVTAAAAAGAADKAAAAAGGAAEKAAAQTATAGHSADKAAAAAAAGKAPHPDSHTHVAASTADHHHYHNYEDHDEAHRNRSGGAAAAAAAAGTSTAGKGASDISQVTAAGSSSSTDRDAAAAAKAAAGKVASESHGSHGSHGPASGSSGELFVSLDGQRIPASQVVYDAAKQLLRVVGLQQADLTRGVVVEWVVAKPNKKQQL